MSRRTASLARCVEDLVERRLPEAGADEAQVARELGMSRRTLQRRLRECGTSYRELLDEVRMRLAMRLLARRDLPVGEVARRLGFSDPANFSRAFRRWTGAPPRTWRVARRGRGAT